VTPPSARIGGKTGLNISKRGVSGSVRTKYGTFNSRRGFSPRLPGRRRTKAKGGCCLPGCGILVMAIMVVPLLGLLLLG
jgi:ribosomal protein S6E (S10)